MTNPTQRFFTVQVTGCKNCFYKAHTFLESYCEIAPPPRQLAVLKENFKQITPSCPMFDQSQEVEK